MNTQSMESYMSQEFDNIFPYTEAEIPKEKTFFETWKIMLYFLIDVIKVSFLSIPAMLQWMYLLIDPKAPKSFKGEVVLLTGGGNGFGRAIAFRLAQEGCNIAILDVDLPAAERTAREVNENDNTVARAKAYQVDVTNVNQIELLKKAIESDFGHVDILFNNAGLLALHSLREGTPSDIRRILEINIASHFWMCRAFLPDMIARHRGHIVAVSSIAGLHGTAGTIAYTTTKWAIRGFMMALEEELRQENHEFIKLSCILPAVVPTRKEFFDQFTSRIPILSPQYAADMAVEGIRRDIREFSIPRPALFILTLLKNLPYEVQQMWVDILDIKFTPPQM